MLVKFVLKYYIMNILEKSEKTLEFDKILSQLATYARTQQSQQLCLQGMN